jgi:OOP family OmpA-OmpF porin
MRTASLLTLAALGALATPAYAQEAADVGPYIGLEAGVLIPEDIRVGGPAFQRIVLNKGFDGGAVAGYDFGMFRLEAEFVAQHAKGNARNTARRNNLSPVTGLVGGDHRVLAGMANAMFDFGSPTSVNFFAGGGIGYAWRRAQYWDVDNNAGPVGAIALTPSTDRTDGAFAWQAVAGIRYPLSPKADLGLKYRYFNAGRFNYGGTGLTGTERWRTHSVLATLTFNLGRTAPVEEAPLPPPAPAPLPEAAPPPAPVAVCNKGPYIVFFDWDRSDITAEASSILDSAVQAYGSCESVPIMLAGYADRSGSAQYNVGLSARRNASVRGYLTSHGIADGAITSQAFGETNPRVPTADGVRELQNRRVEITYGPGSGS